MQLVLATTNQGKINEIKALFKSRHIELICLSSRDLADNEPFYEQGKTFTENAQAKAIHYSCRLSGEHVIAEDSGLEVPALDGAPGIYSARFAGPDAHDKQNIDKLLTLMVNISWRQARFVSVLALAFNGKLMNTFHGQVNGLLTRQRFGENGFGYDPVFYYPPLKKTFAQLPSTEKNKISHRYLAWQQLIDFITSNQRPPRKR